MGTFRILFNFFINHAYLINFWLFKVLDYFAQTVGFILSFGQTLRDVNVIWIEVKQGNCNSDKTQGK